MTQTAIDLQSARRHTFMTSPQSSFPQQTPPRSVKEKLRIILAICIIIAGITHFIAPDPFIKIVPPYLPNPAVLVYISGFFEILGGVGILVPPVSQAAAWGLLLLFIAVFPANINMAVNAIDLPNIPDSDALRWARLPFQAVLIAWAWWYTKPDDLARQTSILPNYGAKSIALAERTEATTSSTTSRSSGG
jgi:uncharacterized membrane protein